MKQKNETKKVETNSMFQIKESDMQILFKDTALTLTLAEYDILKLLIQRNHGVVVTWRFYLCKW